MMRPEEDLCDFRICDLGGAKWFPEGAETATHTYGMGTRGYLAPEAYRRQHHSEITYDAFGVDVYSLGVVLYIALCGYPPWDLLKSEPDKRRHPPLFRTKNGASLPWAKVPPQAIALITSMLEPAPERRI